MILLDNILIHIKIIIYYYNKNMSNNNIIIEDNNVEIKVKKTRNRLTKKQQFEKERGELINKLNNILGISDKQNTFYLYDVENSNEIKEQIKELVEDVKKYFKCGTWNYFIASNSGEEAKEIGLIRAIYRDEGIILTKKERHIERNSSKVRSVQYFIMKNL